MGRVNESFDTKILSDILGVQNATDEEMLKRTGCFLLKIYEPILEEACNSDKILTDTTKSKDNN